MEESRSKSLQTITDHWQVTLSLRFVLCLVWSMGTAALSIYPYILEYCLIARPTCFWFENLFFLKIIQLWNRYRYYVVEGGYKQCSGTVTFWNGFGSADSYSLITIPILLLIRIRIRILIFSSVASRHHQITVFFSIFLLFTFCRYIYISLQS